MKKELPLFLRQPLSCEYGFALDDLLLPGLIVVTKGGMFVDKQEKDVFRKPFVPAAEELVIAIEVFFDQNENGFYTMFGEAFKHRFVEVDTFLHTLGIFRGEVCAHPILEKLVAYIIVVISEPLVRLQFAVRF